MIWGSPTVAFFAASTLAIIVIGLGILFTKRSSGRPLVVNMRVSAEFVVFDAGNAQRQWRRSLVPAGAAMLVSLFTLFWRGELFGGQETAVFSGAGWFVSVAFLAAAITAIIAGLKAWPDTSGARLTINRDGVTLTGVPTGGAATWSHIAGAQVVAERATVLANYGNLSWASRDLTSDPAIIAGLITFYAENPEERLAIGPRTCNLLTSGAF